METTKQFPVEPGTVVEVTCTYPGELTGSFQVTCNSDTIFTYDYETEPRCTATGNGMEKFKARLTAQHH